MRLHKYVVCLMTAWLCVACGEQKPQTAETTDSIADAANATAADTTDTVAPPAAADGLFDDFVYNFMRNREFQFSRIKFPLSNTVDGKAQPIDRSRWTFDPLYARSDMYTMLFDSEKSVGSEKDTTVHHVTVEWIYLKTDRVKQYHFSKERGAWMLTSIDTHTLKLDANYDFFNFYNRFSTDEHFQLKHISNPFDFKTFDSDTFQPIDGVLDVNQWPDFKPDLPHDIITNINYSQHYTDNGQRVLVITSPSAGMSCTLSFKKQRGVWRLVGMESI